MYQINYFDADKLKFQTGVPSRHSTPQVGKNRLVQRLRATDKPAKQHNGSSRSFTGYNCGLGDSFFPWNWPKVQVLRDPPEDDHAHRELRNLQRRSGVRYRGLFSGWRNQQYLHRAHGRRRICLHCELIVD